MNPDKRADRDVRPYRVRRKITDGAGGGLAAFNGTSGGRKIVSLRFPQSSARIR